jgi:serine/threonine protein kinase
MWLSDGAVDHLRAVADVPDTTGTRYRIIEQIGRGGMGAAYRAEDTVLQREVALKVLRAPEINASVATRMSDEARILARLEHPGIVPIHDAGTLPDGRAYYAMKLVRGKPLGDIVTSATPLAERLRIFRRICEPVAFAHAHGVVHRDLKPENIMVGAFGEVVVVDWGVAKHAAAAAFSADDGVGAGASLENGGPAATLNGTCIGTPGWMAPEQERGDVALTGARADVFGLGAILRFLLQLAPAGASTRVAAASDATAAPDGRGTRHDWRAAPRPLRAICERALAPDPELRYASADELADEIDRFLAGEPVRAYHEPFWVRAERLYRKHRTAILLVLSYLVMRVLLIVFG